MLRVFELPDVLHSLAAPLIGEYLLARHAVGGPLYQTLRVPSVQRLGIRAPMPSLGRRNAAPSATGDAVGGFAGRMQRDGGVLTPISIGFGEQTPLVRIGEGLLGVVPYMPVGLGIEQDEVFDVAVCFAAEVLGVALDSRDVAAKVACAEDFVHQDFDIVADFVVYV